MWNENYFNAISDQFSALRFLSSSSSSPFSFSFCFSMNKRKERERERVGERHLRREYKDKRSRLFFCYFILAFFCFVCLNDNERKSNVTQSNDEKLTIEKTTSQFRRVNGD